ncbi:Uncharacterised protein [Mycobacteroides abscessus subsp. abscessus]|nr:Uncharacterised protein [Mycobacteroides abscessus subsp. abscessus]
MYLPCVANSLRPRAFGGSVSQVRTAVGGVFVRIATPLRPAIDPTSSATE